MPSNPLIDLEEARKNRERIAALRASENQAKTTLALTQPTVQSSSPLIASIPEAIVSDTPKPKAATHVQHTPTYRRDEPYKRGHYHKSSGKTETIANLYNQGYGMRSVAKEVDLSINTVRTIIGEQTPIYVNPHQAEIQRKRRQRAKVYGNIVLDIKDLAASIKAHGNDYTTTELDHRLLTIFQKHMAINPRGVILSLVGHETFGPDDLFKKMYAIFIREILHLDERFIEVAPDTFKLREKHDTQQNP